MSTTTSEATLGGPLSRLGDWLNPVLVKEVRQAQRGRVFAISLVVTVLLVFFAVTLMAMTFDNGIGETPSGREFFSVVYVFLCGAVLLLVPFQAFNSMGSEWDDHTFEMLVLSNLKPRQIVLGKVLASFVQSLVFFAAFLPFIAVAFLLRGVDMLVLVVVLGLTLYASLWLTTVSLMFSTLTRHRFLRVVMMVVLAGSLVGMIASSGALAGEFLRRPDQLTDKEFWLVLPQVLGATTLVGLLAFFISCNVLGHEEENRSTNVRVLLTLGMLAFFLCMVVDVTVPTSGIPREVIFGLTGVAVFALAVAAVFLCTEDERLGRRVAPTVPRNGGLALLTLPWFPGRGRGAAYLLLHLFVLVAGTFALAVFADSFSLGFGKPVAPTLMNDGGLGLLVSSAYVLLYTLVPIGILSLFVAKNRRGRNWTRTVSMMSPLLFFAIPSAIGLMVDSSWLSRGKHVGNGPMTIGYAFDGSLRDAHEFAFLILPTVVLGIVLFLPGIFRACLLYTSPSPRD